MQGKKLEKEWQTAIYRKGTEETVKTEQDRSTFDRRNDEGKDGSESRCDRREVDKRDDYSKKGVKKKTMK